jgi:hypothetical protein
MTSGNVGSLVAGTEYTVVLKVTPNEGYEWYGMNSFLYTFTIKYSAT